MFTQEIKNFATVAKKYSDFVENARKVSLPERLSKFAQLLAELYSIALLLPEVEPTDRDTPKIEKKPIQLEFDEFEFYWMVYDPFEMEDQEPVAGSLTDDLLDIYHDIKRGLLMYEKNTPDDIKDAVWDWRFSFYAHWGNHVVDALRALHWALQR